MLFSITTPCFNSAKTIERTLKSVLCQKCKDYEYIIIDGGSTDGTLDIIKRYELLFEGRMRWISERDKGIYDAFNKGAKLSQGTYCWNVNADDYMEPDALDKLSSIISNYDTDNLPIISAGAYIKDSEDRYVRSIIFNDRISKQLLSKDSIAFVHPATLIPKSVYEAIGYYDDEYRIMGDLDWSRRAWINGYRISFENIFITNMSEGGVSDVLNLRKNIKDRRRYFCRFYKNPFIRGYRFLLWLLFFVKGYYVRKYTKQI